MDDLPILARSAWLEDGQVVIVDETALPQSLVLIRAHDCAQVVEAIRAMKTRAFGQLLSVLYGMLMVAQQSARDPLERQLSALREAAVLLGGARTTFPLRELTDQVLEVAEGAGRRGDSVVQALERRVGEFVAKAQAARVDRAAQVAALVRDGATILTHCNVSGEMVLIGRACRAAGKTVRFIATETRPYFQGARLTAWELAEDGFAVQLIADGAVAHVMAAGLVDWVVVGSDRSAANGDVANKVGTYQIALLARHFGIPFYVLAQPSPTFASGRDIPVEERDPDELLSYRGQRITPEGVQGYYPAFDITPHELITRHFAIRIPRNVLGEDARR